MRLNNQITDAIDAYAHVDNEKEEEEKEEEKRLVYMIPAAFNSHFFCKTTKCLPSWSFISCALYFAFFHCVFLSLALASDYISFSEYVHISVVKQSVRYDRPSSSMSMGSGQAGFVSGSGSISPD